MRFKEKGASEIDFEFPYSFTQGSDRQAEIKAQAKEIDAFLHSVKHSPGREIDKLRGAAHKKKRELWTELRFFNIWRLEIGHRENDLMAEVQQCEDCDIDAKTLAAALYQALRREACRRVTKAGGGTSHEQDLLRQIEQFIRDRIADEIAEEIPESFLDLMVDTPLIPKPKADKAAIWEEIKGVPIRAAVNMIRHRHTDYDRDRFTRPYLAAFTSANMWIADNFPQIADEAIAQIDEKMASGGKRIRSSRRFDLQSG
jgi:hypothetical protein